MKKVLSTYIVCLITAFSMVGVFAYASSASVNLYKNATVDATSAWIGYDFNASATASNDSSSRASMQMTIWASYKGALWPATKEASTTVSIGDENTIHDQQDQTSIYRLVLTPNAWGGYVSGHGDIRLGKK